MVLITVLPIIPPGTTEGLAHDQRRHQEKKAKKACNGQMDIIDCNWKRDVLLKLTFTKFSHSTSKFLLFFEAYVINNSDEWLGKFQLDLLKAP